MQLDRPLGRSEIGPREGREAQLDGGGIERIQRVLETKLVAGRDPLATSQQRPKQGLAQRIRLVPVDARQAGAGQFDAAQVIKPMRLSAQVVDDVAQAVAAGQLRHEQADELRPTRRDTERAATMMPFGQGLEFMSRHPFEELR